MNIRPSKYLQHETYSQMEKRLKRRDNILIAIALLLPMAFIFFFAAITSNASSSDYEQFERCYSRGYETKESLIESFSNSRESITAAYLKKKMVKGDDGLYRFYSERFLDGERCSNQCPEVQYVFHQCLLENLPSGKSKIKLRSALLVCSKVACDP